MLNATQVGLPENPTVEDVAAEIRSSIDSNPNVEVTDEEELTISGMPAYVLEIRETEPIPSSEDVQTYDGVVMFVIDADTDTLYLISTRMPDRSAADKTGKDIIKSLEIVMKEQTETT